MKRIFLSLPIFFFCGQIVASQNSAQDQSQSGKQDCTRAKVDDHPLSAAHNAAAAPTPINKPSTIAKSAQTSTTHLKVQKDKDNGDAKKKDESTTHSHSVQPKTVMAFDRTGKVQRTIADITAVRNAMMTRDIDHIMASGMKLE